MSNLEATVFAELRKNNPSVHRVCEIDLPNGETLRLCKTGGGALSIPGVGIALPRIVRWPSLRRSLGDFRGSVPAVTGSLELDDASSEFQVLAGTYGTRLQFSPVRIRLTSKNWDLADAPIVFSGLLEQWPKTARKQYSLHVRSNDLWLKTSIQRPTFRYDDFPNADSNIYGQFLPKVYGIHDSTGMTHFGAVPLYLVDEDTGLFCPSQGRAENVIRVYSDAELGTIAASFTVSYETRNGKLFTFVSAISPTPAEGARVTCDIEGFAETMGGSAMTNPIDILKHVLVNYGYGEAHRSGAWKTVGSSGAPLNETAFDAAAAYAEAKSFMSSRVFSEALTVEDVLQEFCVTFGMRCFWDWNGKLAIVPRTHLLPAGTRPWIRWDRDSLNPPNFPDAGIDGYLSHAISRYCYQEALGDYVRSMEVRNMNVTSFQEVSETYDFRPSNATLVS